MSGRLQFDPGAASASPAVAGSTADDVALSRRGQRVQEQARKAGIHLPLLGISPVFAETRAYAGDGTDWLLGPLPETDVPVIPRQPRHDLDLLRRSGVRFSALYVAHEIPQGRLPVDPASVTGPIPVDPAVAEGAVGPVPVAQSSVELSKSLGQASDRLMRTVAAALPVLGVLAATPVLLAAGAVSAVSKLDPVIFGVVTNGVPRAGRAGAWFVLTSWEW